MDTMPCLWLKVTMGTICRLCRFNAIATLWSSENYADGMVPMVRERSVLRITNLAHVFTSQHSDLSPDHQRHGNSGVHVRPAEVSPAPADGDNDEAHPQGGLQDVSGVDRGPVQRQGTLYGHKEKRRQQLSKDISPEYPGTPLP